MVLYRRKSFQYFIHDILESFPADLVVRQLVFCLNPLCSVSLIPQQGDLCMLSRLKSAILICSAMVLSFLRVVYIIQLFLAHAEHCLASYPGFFIMLCPNNLIIFSPIRLFRCLIRKKLWRSRRPFDLAICIDFLLNIHIINLRKPMKSISFEGKRTEK